MRDWTGAAIERGEMETGAIAADEMDDRSRTGLENAMQVSSRNADGRGPQFLSAAMSCRPLVNKMELADTAVSRARLMK